jgi:hypothetical protein
VEFIPTEFVTFARKILFVLPVILPALLLDATAQDSPPKIDSFEEAVPAGANQTAPQFRMTYPVRDASSGQTFTEQKPSTAQDVPSAVSDADIAAGLAMPDPGPAPSTTTGTASALQNDEAALDAVGTAGNPPLQEIDIGEGRYTGFPLRFTVGLQEGYNSNVYATQNNPTQSAFTALNFGVYYDFGSPRLTITTSLTGNLSYYYAAQNQNWLPNVYWGLDVEYNVTPRLTLGFNTTTAYLTQGSAGLYGAPVEAFNQGYFYSSSGFEAEYAWAEKFSTITTYSPLFLIYSDNNQQNQLGRVQQTFGQQFLYLWRPTTSLVAEYRLGLVNYFSANDLNSWGNYFLGGFNHTLNPGSELVFRGGLQQNFNQIPTIYGGGENTTYNPYVQLGFDNQLGKDTSIGFQGVYSSLPSGYGNINQSQQLLLGLSLSRNITSRLAATGGIYYQNNYYNQPGYSTAGNILPGSFYSNVYSAGISLAYKVYRNWSLTAGYRFNATTSGNEQQVVPYNQNIAYIGVQAEFGGRRRE